MREELMKEALCWELEAKVTAEYAYGDKGLLYFCPEEGCLEPVRPAQRVNVYFRAPNRHKEGCPNEAQPSEPSPIPGAQKKKPLAEPVIPIPTHLGPSLPIKKKGRSPSQDDLRKLAQALMIAQPCHPGTFEEVVRAWATMTTEERKSRRLNIQGVDTTYHDAFHFLAWAGDDIDQLDSQTGIVFGMAKIYAPQGFDCYLVDSVKRFKSDPHTLPIRLVSPKKSSFPANIPELVGKVCTFFWHGPRPSLEAGKGKSYRIRAEQSQAYQGVVILEGDLHP
jgi:hypothetical protein